MAYHQFYEDGDKKYISEDDLDEEQVWNSMMEKKDNTLKERKNKESSLSALLGHHPSATVKNKASLKSAPMNIPERPKLSRNKTVGESSFHGEHGSWGARQFYDGFEEEECEGNEGNMIPPHEWIEKRAARRQVSSFSMCEGIGRTLKGRDLRRVRNAVLARTGFLE